jgi:hypothetical protein
MVIRPSCYLCPFISKDWLLEMAFSQLCNGCAVFDGMGPKSIHSY